MSGHQILLLEPGYPNKYPPLGLMKLATYHRRRGDNVRLMKGSKLAPLLHQPWDRVYVTTLFSFEWKRTAEAIDAAIGAAKGQRERVFVGGIAASLMHEEFMGEPRWAGVRFIKGLLDRPPAISLQLSTEDFEFGANDVTGTPIDELTPDYSILKDLEDSYTYPVIDAYFGYASRGCVRKCSFCGVPKLEGPQREMPPLTQLVEGIMRRYGEKKDLVLMDNNVTASRRYKEVIAEIVDLGFEKDATLRRPGGRPAKRRVDFNQGVDARILAKSPMFLEEMSKICISPLRIAFDHIGVRKVYETSVRMAADNEISELSNYMLYNFMDTPGDLYERMHLNITLHEELGVRIWSFPMRYQPVTLKDRSHVGKHWNRYYLRSFQIMLQATRGIVSGNPMFFERAYGGSQDEFRRLLTLPHGFIFHREHYEHGDGKGVREAYEKARNALSKGEEEELIQLLVGPPEAKSLPRDYYRQSAADKSIGRKLREVMQYHVLDTRDRLNSSEVRPLFAELNPDPVMPAEDELVEDAGLFDAEHGRDHESRAGHAN